MQRSRLFKREEQRTYKKIFLAVLATITAVVLIIFLGIPALLNMANFISNIKGEGDIPIKTQNSPLPPPNLEYPYEATNTATISLKGNGLPGTKVSLLVNGGGSQKILIANDGNFIFDNVALDQGENKIWAISENSVNEKSEKSDILNIIYNNEKPKIEITEPSDNASYSGDNNEVKISGATEEGITITINDRLVIVNKDNTFSDTMPLKEGDNKIVIIAKDDAGNITKVEKTVKYSP